MLFIFAICCNYTVISKLASIIHRDGKDCTKIKCSPLNFYLQRSAYRFSLCFYDMESRYDKVIEECCVDIDWGVTAMLSVLLGGSSLFCGVWLCSDIGFIIRLLYPLLVRDAESIRQIADS